MDEEQISWSAGVHHARYTLIKCWVLQLYGLHASTFRHVQIYGCIQIETKIKSTPLKQGSNLSVAPRSIVSWEVVPTPRIEPR
jgi:hypothetical protein